MTGGALRSGNYRKPLTPNPKKGNQKRPATQVPAVCEYELEKKKRMEDNAARMKDVLMERAASMGIDKQDFMAEERKFVYGGAQLGQPSNKKSTEVQDKRLEDDPEYEPTANEIENDDDEHTDVEESTPVQQKMRSKSVVPPSNIATRSRTTPAPEASDLEMAPQLVADNSENMMSSTQIITSGDSNSPDHNQIVQRKELTTISSHSKRKRGGRRPTMGHGLHEYTRRNGGNKMEIEFTPGVKRPTNPLHAANLSSECGVHIRSNKMALATHWKQYKKDESLKNVIPNAIKRVGGKFAMDTNNEDAQAVCTDIIQSCVRQHRYRLKKAYWNKIKDLTPEQAYLLKPENVQQQSWEELVNRWFDEHYQDMCEKNKTNREGVKQKHTTGSRCYVAHYEHLRAQMEDQETSPIEFYRLSHTNKYGLMTAEAQTAYDAMVSFKNAPRAENEANITDAQIVEQVLNDKSSSSSSTSTFLARLGIASSSRKNSISAARIRELEERLADQEHQSVAATEKYHHEMEARMQAQEQKFEEMRRKQDEELEALKKSQDEKNLAAEKRHQEMEALLGFLLRTSKQPSAPPS